MEAEDVLGIISEEDILLATYKDLDSFTRPTKDFMSTKLKTLAPSAEIDEVIDLIKKNFTPIIKDQDGFYGLITQYDLLNFLRLKTKKK